MKRALIFALMTVTLCAAADLPTAKPESVGFSSDRLQNLHSLIQNEIDQKQLAGAVTILARHGKIIDYRTYGQRDMEKSVPMTKDTIVRAYSMTKPMTGTAMMILYEQGKWLPWHPISRYIPEFAHLKVFNGFDTSGHIILVDPEHAPTVGEVMSHSAGFSYGSGQSPVDAMYHEKSRCNRPTCTRWSRSSPPSP
jgi:CubicO group peptidase (beta-lactamase class C family)